MEFPLHLTGRWGGKRYNSFNRVLKNTFNAIEHELEARNAWQGKSYAESARYRVRITSKLPFRVSCPCSCFSGPSTSHDHEHGL